MKGLKLLALVSGFAICTSCLPQSSSAQGAPPETANQASDAPPPFNELNASKERGVRLDELFKSFGATKATSPIKAATVTKQITPAKATNHRVISSAESSNKATLAIHPKTKGVHTNTTKISKVPAPVNHVDDRLLASDSNILPVSHPQSSSALVTASLDRGGALPKYKSGDHMVVTVSALTDCNVVVFDYDAKNTLTQLFPNQYEPDGKLRAGQSIQVGGESSHYTLDLAGKGKEHIFVYSYPISEQPITMAMAQIPHTPFRSAEITPEQYSRFVRESRVYDRSVSVKPKTSAQPVSQHQDNAANKVELTFEIEK